MESFSDRHYDGFEPVGADCGAAAPDISFSDSVGGSARLSGLRGTPLILAFLSSEWDPARAEYLACYNELLQDAATPVTGKDDDSSRMMLLNLASEQASPWKTMTFADSSQIRLPLLVERDSNGEAARLYGVAGKQAIFVIDASGSIRSRFVAPSGAYPRPEAVRSALLDAVRPPCGAETVPMKAGSVTRRDFVATALAAALALAIFPAAMPSRAQDPAIKGVASPLSTPTIPVTLTINGAPHTMNLDSRVTLLDALREYIGLTGSKKGCDHGQCGACTVHIDGRRVNACLTLAVMSQNKAITTIEGLAVGDQLHPIQTAFIKHDGFQCGYCTPGQIMSAVALLKEGHAQSTADVRELMSGNICRCGAYPNIVDAIEEVRTGNGGATNNASV